MARQEQGARSPLIWYGHFDWAGHHPFDASRARFCGVGDDILLGGRPQLCSGGRGSVVAPFASGGLDIRSRALAASACGRLCGTSTCPTRPMVRRAMGCKATSWQGVGREACSPSTSPGPSTMHHMVVQQGSSEREQILHSSTPTSAAWQSTRGAAAQGPRR